MEKSEELRAYFFNNMYLQGIHAGIQTQHCTTEIFNKYYKYTLSQYQSEQSLTLNNWATNHKTTIVLNGGYASNLRYLIEIFNDTDNPYPFGYFCESEEALEDCITSVGIILPKKVFEGSKYVTTSLIKDRYVQLNNITSFELKIMKELSQCKLMN